MDYTINDMYRVEAPNVEWTVKPEVHDSRIMEMVSEVVYLFQLLKRSLPDLKIESGVDMLLGAVFKSTNPGALTITGTVAVSHSVSFGAPSNTPIPFGAGAFRLLSSHSVFDSTIVQPCRELVAPLVTCPARGAQVRRNAYA